MYGNIIENSEKITKLTSCNSYHYDSLVFYLI